MGQAELWRAQLTTLSRVDRVYSDVRMYYAPTALRGCSRLSWLLPT